MVDADMVSNPQATGNMRWYVIHAYSGMEKSVKKGLEERIARSEMADKFGRILVPSEEVVEIKSGHLVKLKSQKPLIIERLNLKKMDYFVLEYLAL